MRIRIRPAAAIVLWCLSVQAAGLGSLRASAASGPGAPSVPIAAPGRMGPSTASAHRSALTATLSTGALPTMTARRLVNGTVPASLTPIAPAAIVTPTWAPPTAVVTPTWTAPTAVVTPTWPAPTATMQPERAPPSHGQRHQPSLIGPNDGSAGLTGYNGATWSASPASGALGASIQVSYTDPEPGIAAVAIYLDATVACSGATSVSCAVSTSGLTSGPHVISLESNAHDHEVSLQLSVGNGAFTLTATPADYTLGGYNGATWSAYHANGSVGDTVQISYSDPSATGTSVILDGATVCGGAVTATACGISTAGLSTGQHTVSLQSVQRDHDVALQVTVSSGVFTLTAPPPAYTLSGNNGATWSAYRAANGDETQVSYTDPEPGIAGVAIYLDGVLACSNSSATIGCSLSLSGLSSGQHSIMQSNAHDHDVTLKYDTGTHQVSAVAADYTLAGYNGAWWSTDPMTGGVGTTLQVGYDVPFGAGAAIYLNGQYLCGGAGILAACGLNTDGLAAGAYTLTLQSVQQSYDITLPISVSNGLYSVTAAPAAYTLSGTTGAGNTGAAYTAYRAGSGDDVQLTYSDAGAGDVAIYLDNVQECGTVGQSIGCSFHAAGLTGELHTVSLQSNIHDHDVTLYYNAATHLISLHPLAPPTGPQTANVQGSGSQFMPTTTCGTARPVNCDTGDFWHTFDDFAIPGRGLPLHLTRTYNAQTATQDGPLGFGWTDSYNMALSTDASGVVTETEGNAAAVAFTPIGGGGYQASSGAQVTLVTNRDGTLRMTSKDGVQFVFTAPTTNTVGQLLKEVDRNGYATTLRYSGGTLASVTDPAGRSLGISYNAAGRIASVSDPIGRTVAFTYDASGNLTDAQDVSGGVTHFTYDSNHQMLTMRDPRGGVVTNVYDGVGRVIAQTDPLGRTTTFTYTLNNDGSQRSVITDPNGSVTVEYYLSNELLSLTKGYGTPQAATWTYSYDPASLGIASQTDPNGHTSSNTYDANGNLLSHTDALGRATTYQYDSLNDTTAITDPLGVTTVMTYDASGNLLQVARPLTQTGQTALTTLTYDPAHPGDVLTRTDPNGHTWHYAYDQYGDLASSSDPLSETTTYAYDTIGRRTSLVRPLGNVQGANPISYTTTYTYDAFGDTTAMTDALGHATTYQYDPNRNLTAVTDANTHTTRYGYDLDNERTSITRPDTGVWLTGYDGAGNVLTQTDALSHTTTYQYDPLNRRVSVTDPRGGVTLTAYDLGGNVISTTDPLSHTTLFGYDAANERISRTRPDGGVWTTGYDLDGRVVTQTDALTHTTVSAYDSLGRRISVTDPLTRTTVYSYDLAGNLTATTDPNQHTTSAGYDSANRRVTITRADGSVWLTAYDADGNVVSSTDPLSHTTTSSYDVLDRLLSTTDALSHTTRYSYDAVGNRVRMTDPLTHTTCYQYDALNRVVAVTDPLTHSTLTAYDLAGNVLSTTDALSHTTTYGYDAANELITTTLPTSATQLQSFDLAGNRTRQTDALGRVTAYGYDSLNRLITMTDPLTRTWTYTYDRVDNRLSLSDPAGRVTAYGYDPAHELTSITYTSSTTPNVAYSYTPSGQRATMSDGTGTTTYQYDALDRPLTVTNGASKTVGYGYDLAGHLTTLTYPDSSVITRTYDAANRLTGLTDWLGHTTGFYYDAANRLVTQTLPTTPTALTSLSYYNAANQLTGIQDTATGTLFWTFGYGRDADGRLSSTLDPLVGYQVYSGDSLNRLSGDQASAPYTSTTGWDYDAASEPTTLSYSSTTSLVTDTLGYDLGSELQSLRVQLNGTLTHNDVYTDTVTGDRSAVSDLVSGAAGSYGWDQADRLITATNGITASSYAYNGDGLRLSKTVSGTTEGFVWDTAEGLPLLLQDGGTRYVLGPDGTPVESVSVTGTVLYYLHDQESSTRGLFASSGQNVASYTYTPFGALSLHTGSVTTPLQYAGQYTDAETGWQYLQARYYDPASSQFVSVDPLVQQTGQPYAYAADDPLNGVDPSGLCQHGLPLCPWEWFGQQLNNLGTGVTQAVIGLGSVLDTGVAGGPSGASPCDIALSDQQVAQDEQAIRDDTTVANVGLLVASGPSLLRGGAGFVRGLRDAGEGTSALEGASTATEYTNLYGGNSGIIAQVDSDGVLNLAIERGPGTPSGSAMFDEAMKVVGPNVKAVRGTWNPFMPDNLNSFNAAIRAGMSPEEAAMSTFTGKMAARYGFTNVAIEQLAGSPGDYTKVVVLFTK